MGHWLTRSGQIEPCVYQPGLPSRYEVIIPTKRLTDAEVDELHAAGARRSGWLFYTTDCPSCSDCQPLRIDLSTFRLSRSQKRVWKANQDLRVEVGAPKVSARRVELYNLHLNQRGLNTNDQTINSDHYAQWLVESGIQTLEFTYYCEDQLVGVGLVDRGEKDASSVYFYFDSKVSKRSLGTFSVLKEIDWLTQQGSRFHYLGFYNQACKALRYKAAFGPHELLEGIQGEARWQSINGERGSSS